MLILKTVKMANLVTFAFITLEDLHFCITHQNGVSGNFLVS